VRTFARAVVDPRIDGGQARLVVDVRESRKRDVRAEALEVRAVIRVDPERSVRLPIGQGAMPSEAAASRSRDARSATGTSPSLERSVVAVGVVR